VLAIAGDRNPSLHRGFHANRIIVIKSRHAGSPLDRPEMIVQPLEP
jgi:hypothetical protein